MEPITIQTLLNGVELARKYMAGPYVIRISMKMLHQLPIEEQNLFVPTTCGLYPTGRVWDQDGNPVEITDETQIPEPVEWEIMLYEKGDVRIEAEEYTPVWNLLEDK